MAKVNKETLLTVIKFLPFLIVTYIMVFLIHLKRFFNWDNFNVNPFALNLWEMFTGSFKPFRFTGDKFVPTDHAIVISNHYSDCDGPILYKTYSLLAPQLNQQMVMKAEVARLPAVGFWARTVGAAVVTRKNPEKDVKSIQKMAKRHDGWPTVFPEGRVHNEETLEWARAKRVELNLPDATHVILPQPKGIHALLSTGEYDTVYDVTMTYEGYDGSHHNKNNPKMPTMMHFVDRVKDGAVHIDIRRLKINPAEAKNYSVQDVADFLNNRWAIKEARIDYFVKHGRYPNDQEEEAFIKSVVEI